MKETFFKLPEEKRLRVIHSAIAEFSLAGYEKTSLDNIVRRAGISKGGLYEYIDSKEDLFQYALEFSYGAMFEYISSRQEPHSLVTDPVERTGVIASVAVDFYLERPEIISFLVKASTVEQGDVRSRAQGAFDSYFARLYEGCAADAFRFELERLLHLIKWLLLKTRNDFTASLEATGRAQLCKSAYLEEWDFFISVLRSGVYRS